MIQMYFTVIMSMQEKVIYFDIYPLFILFHLKEMFLYSHEAICFTEFYYGIQFQS